MNTNTLHQLKTQELYKKARAIIPGGTQLLSKRPEMFLPGLWPAYYSRAKGCEVWDLDGNHYYDVSIMGVGANTLGYAFDEVDNAAKEAIDDGGMCTLNAPEEVLLAEKLIELHPWAEMVRYAKTGGEAMSIAVRIARAATRKDIVLVCGYHGWHDWYLAANLVKGDPLGDVHLRGLEPVGVPSDLEGSNYVFHYNAIEEFDKRIELFRGRIAAVVMEPIRNDYPKDEFLTHIRETTAHEGIVLVFDEITAGFRLCTGGSHLDAGVGGVIPDIAVFAKGMTNGYPLSAIIGKREYMNAAQETFISSTYWTERVALAATLKAIMCFDALHVADYLKKIGKEVQEKWAETAKSIGVNIRISGIYPLSHFEFEYEDSIGFKTFFTQEMLRRGFLASTGFYMSYAHTHEVLEKYFDAYIEVLQMIYDVVRAGDDIRRYLQTDVCHSGFERLN